MTDLLLPLATSSWDEREIQALHDGIASDRYTMGSRVAEFERRFAEFFGVGHAVMVHSGSSANLLGMAAWAFRQGLGLSDDWEVIVPAVSWSTTYYPVCQFGGRLVFVDVDPETLNLNPDQVRAAIGPKTKAILAVSLLGNPCDFSALREIADEANITLLEDNCESMGARVDGRFTGTFGFWGTFSSFFSHHISTMEGGIVVTKDEDFAHLMRSMRAHGWTRGLPEQTSFHESSGDPFQEQFRFVVPGYNLRPLEMSGALGIEQLKKLPGLIEGRRENAVRFRELFSDHPHIRIQAENGESSWFGFSMLLDGPLRKRRGDVVKRLHEMGVECRPIITGNFTRNPVLEYLPHRIVGDLQNADWIHDAGLFIGNHHYPVGERLETVRAGLDDL